MPETYWKRASIPGLHTSVWTSLLCRIETSSTLLMLALEFILLSYRQTASVVQELEDELKFLEV